jgi:large subunit ribosomal protein L21
MFAIINHKGKQYKVTEGDKIKIDRSDLKKDSTINFENVIFISKGDKTEVGQPTIKGASVTGKFIEEQKDKKIIIFKKIRRHNYRRKNGHRQKHSLIHINKINFA